MFKLKIQDNLTQRTITGTILVMLISLLVSWSAYTFILLILTLNFLSLKEFYRLFQSESLKPNLLAGSLFSAFLILTFSLCLSGTSSRKLLLVNIPLVFGLFVAELYRKSLQPVHNLAFTFFGILYITIPFIFFESIAFLAFNQGIYYPEVVMGYFFILWASDAGAYFIGKEFGAHALFSRISPHKTWEGSLGGAFFALVIAYVNSTLFNGISMADWVILSVIVVISGTYGDLGKSLIKRSLNIKDSGTILPGHGGMLDRFDTLLGSAPFAFCYFMLLSDE